MKKQYFLLGALLLLTVGLLAACGNNIEGDGISEDAQAAIDAGEFPNAHLIVDPDQLEAQQADANVIVIDVRGDDYASGHIPGAIHLPSNQLNDPDNPFNGFLKGEEDFTALMQANGINQDSKVIIYDAGNNLSAARLFYALEIYGLKDNVAVLNGGFAAWLVSGKDVSTEATVLGEGNFVAQLNPDLQSDLNRVSSDLGNENVVILDTRSDGEYDGSDARAEKGGHIPGAVHNEWNTVQAEDTDGVTRFKSPQVLAAEFDSIGVVKNKTIVPYCQTNVRGAHTYLTLRLLGYEDVRPYEGSWSEWGNTESTPVATL